MRVKLVELNIMLLVLPDGSSYFFTTKYRLVVLKAVKLCLCVMEWAWHLSNPTKALLKNAGRTYTLCVLQLLSSKSHSSSSEKKKIIFFSSVL